MSPKLPKYRFYLDENFPAPAGKFLRAKGHNVFYVVSKETLRGISDLAQIKEANRQKRVFVALDKDFKTKPFLLGSIKKGLGIILIESADPQSEKIITILKRLLEETSEKKLRGKICRVSIDKIAYQ